MKMRKEYIQPICDVTEIADDDTLLAGSGGSDASGEIGQGNDNEPTYSKTFNFIGMSSDDDNNGYGL